ncbi:MAG: TIGR03943 family protein [Synechococcus sp. TMED187]|nr:MAG: TIGR03943 family protein [Synechococcus sp. TMED187]RZO10520.1 MAG: TIGR03943 family protein [Synechococcus sp. MED-G135]|tara:strand:+ start:729 stop:1427 length:699 start_codon:yes stop_codon:yes gene_type:complete
MTLRLRWSSLSLPLLLLLWGWVMVWSTASGRLDLLLRSVYHPVVAVGGGLLILIGLLQLRLLLRRKRAGQASQTLPRGWWLTALVALAIIVFPPQPSFNDLASSRPSSLPEAPRLAFVLPPEQRTLTEWVRLLRTQPDPSLHAGAPVSISGFVLKRPGEPAQLARLMVRCCLADATPSGLPVLWPEGFDPKPDTWLEVKGKMVTQEHDGALRNVLEPSSLKVIPRPERPLEP